MSVLKRVLAVAALAALVSPAFAAEPSCVGTDLIAKAQAEAPDEYAAFAKAGAAVPNAEGLLWRVTAPGVAPSYLFGTMHSTEADLVALNPDIRKALGETKTVAVELADASGPAVQAEMIAYVTANALDLTGGGLAGLDAAQKAEIERRLGEAGFPAAAARALKPWFLGITLQVSACETKRMTAGLKTVDFAVEAIGREAGAAIVGLESVREQLDAASKVSDETARKMIRDAVASPTAGPDLQATTLALYRARRVGWYLAMKDTALGKRMGLMDDGKFMDELIDRRNALMLERSKPLIAKGPTFVAVGALHLPGPKGLVALYREAGLTVDRVW